MNSKRKELLIAFGLCFLISALGAILGAGYNFRSFLRPEHNPKEFSKIHPDKWIESGAQINFSNLASSGNWLEFKFSDWHPSNLESTKYRVLVCQKALGNFIAEPGSSHRISLAGKCEPRKVFLQVLNPFVASEQDTRALGSQLEYVRVGSSLYFPWLNFKTWAFSFALVFILSFLLVVLTKGYQSQIVAAGIFPALSSYFFAGISWQDNLFLSLWLILFALFTGSLISSKTYRSVREGKSNNKVSIGFYAVLIALAGLVLRLYNIDFGLPANFHPDEVPKYNAIMRMRNYGDFNPRYFLHPSILLYSTYFANSFLHSLGVYSQAWPETLIQSGRYVSALAGSISIFLTYYCGKKLFSPLVGLGGAAFLAVAPLHVTCSRYVKEDALLTLFVLACAAALIKAVIDKKPAWIIVAGVFAGISASTKYTGLLCLLIVLSAPFFTALINRHEGKIDSFKSIFDLDLKTSAITILALLLIPTFFVLCSPYTLLDHQTFLKDFNHERAHMSKGHTILISASSQLWLYHWTRSILPGLTFGMAFLGTIGIGALLWSRKVSAWFLVSLILLFYLPSEWVKAKPSPQPERYILPCLPFICLAGVYLLSQAKRYFRYLSALVLVACITMAGYKSATLSYEIGQDTRVKLANWMLEYLPQGKKIFVDWKPYSVSFPDEEFEIVYLPRSRIIPSLDYRSLKESGVDYLVLSSLFYDRYFSQPGVNPALREQIRQVFRKFQVVKEFEPKYGTYGFHNPKLTLFDLK